MLKHIGNFLVWVVLLVVFLPLILGLFFGMPVEFVMASWHLVKVSEQTTGTILEAEVAQSRGRRGGIMTQSRVRYAYEVAGKTYESSRITSGFLSSRGYQQGGGDYAQSLPAGSTVTVYFDPSRPGFSLLVYGWPTWSLGFSAIVWGIFFSNLCPPGPRGQWRMKFRYGMPRALIATGFATIVFCPIVIAPAQLKFVLATWLVGTAVFSAVGVFKAHTGKMP